MRRAPYVIGSLWSSRRLFGDINSGQVAALVSVAGARGCVILDDGSATVATTRQLAEGARLRRPGVAESASRRLLSRTASARWRRALRLDDIELFTAYAGTVDAARLAALGATVTPNSYTWTRSADLDTGLSDATHVIVGSALAEDGMIGHERYLAWVRSVADPGAVYVPHRRESNAGREAVASAGVRVVALPVPIEVAVASATLVTRVSTLPSSVVATLPGVLVEGARLTVTKIEEEWWRPAADPEFRALLGRIAGMS
jgi:hypothetical protein